MKKTLPDKKDGAIHHYIKSTIYSVEGLISYFFEERSCRLYLGCSIFVIVLGFILNINLRDWLIIGVYLIVLLAVELLNTALESVVDLVTQEYHPLAKRAKDLGSAATFVLTLLGLMIGIFLFIPYFS